MKKTNMNISPTKLMKLWITVALCFGVLSDALEARTNSSPPEALVGSQKPSPVADPSRVYGGLFYPHDESPLAAGGDDDSSFYLDQEPPQEDGLAAEEEDEQEPKRSMGMLRLGRSGAAPLDKRPRTMAALRLGRRSAAETGNKRSMGMLRLGRTASAAAAAAAGDYEGEDGKEEGKRSMGMLRLGRSQGLRRRASLGR